MLKPEKATKGTKTTFCVHGQSISIGSIIVFDGNPIQSKRVDATQICAEPELDLTNTPAGQNNVYLKTTDGTRSNTERLLVEPLHKPAQIHRVLPFVWKLKATQKIGIYGERIPSNTAVLVGQHQLPTQRVTYRSTTYIEVLIDLAERHWREGVWEVRLHSKNHGKSNGFKITIAK